MDVIAHKRGHAQAAVLSLASAVSAISVAAVGYQGASASTYALLGISLLGLILFSALMYLRPMVTLVIAIIFLTSPIPLVLTLRQSALASAVLLGATSLGLAVRTQLRAVTPDPMILPIGVFAAYGLFSAAYGLWAGNDVGYVLGDCFQVIEFALVYFLISRVFRDRATIHRALRFWLFSILGTVLVELLLFALGPNAGQILPHWEGSSGSEELVRTIDIDATILFAVLINVYPITTTRRQRFWIWAALIPTAANIALSLSRGLWLCTLLAVVVSLLLQGGKVRNRVLKASALVSCGGVLLAAAWNIESDSDSSMLDVFEERLAHGVDQVEAGFAGTESMATRRFLEIASVGPQVLASPWLGHGLGATYVIGGFAVLDAGTDAPIDHHFIHNLYLVTAFRMGLIGLGLLLFVLFHYFRRLLKAYRKMPAGTDKALVTGFAAAVIGQLLLSLTQPTILDHPTCALIACVMAVSVRLSVTPQSVNQQIGLRNGV
jgi:O-antigen ligase